MNAFKERVLITVLAILLGSGSLAHSPTPASAQRVPMKSADATIEEWAKEMHRIDGLARNGKYRKAETLLGRLSMDVIGRLSHGGEAFLGHLCALQALAQAGQGNEREAAWDWQVALQLFPDLQQFGLDTYGEAGAFLATVESPPSSEAEARDVVEEKGSEEVEGEILPPRKISTPYPAFPMKVHTQGPVTVILSMVIREDGRVTEPKVLDSSGDPLAVFSGLMTIRDWRFRPARLDGEPVDAVYNLQLNFVSDYDKGASLERP